MFMQLIGEMLEVKGKVVPEFAKVRKYFVRKRKERETFEKMSNTLEKAQDLISDLNQHYSADNIRMRDSWIKNVNEKLEKNDAGIRELAEKLDKNNRDTLSLLVDSKRSMIINFASKVVDENSVVTKEQFNRIFKVHKEYDDIIRENGMTNGEVDIAIRIIRESYENHMRNHSFLEDVRGYNKGG